MDRNISYAGQVPRALDLLRTGEFAMVGLAKLAEAMLGASTVVSQGGFAVTPGGGLNIAVGPGQIYQLQSIEPTSLSALNADGRQVLKQGVALDAQTLTLAPPTAVGYAQSFLIQAAYADVPDGKIVLSYQNPTPVLDPSTGALKYVTYPGPGGSGDQQYTILRGGVALNPKPGAAAPAGQQTIPAPDAGCVGLYVVTLAYGATSIAGGNIAPYAGAPFIPLSLVQVAAREIATVQSAGLSLNGGDPTEMAQAMARGIWVDNLTGTGDLAVATLSVVLPSLLKGMRIGGVATAANTVTNPKLRVLNLGTPGLYTDFPILKEDGSALVVGDIKSGRRYRYEADGAGNVLITGGGIGGLNAAGVTQILNARPGQIIVWIDPVNGSESNDGSTSAVPRKSLDAVLEGAGPNALDIRLLGDTTLSNVHTAYASHSISGAAAISAASQQFTPTLRNVSVLGTAANSPVGNNISTSAGLWIFAPGVRSYYINYGVNSTPGGQNVQSIFTSFINTTAIFDTCSVSAAGSGGALLGRSIGLIDAEFNNLTLNAPGRLFVGISAGNNPNAVRGYGSNVTSA